MDEIAALTGAAAATVVSAMATDTWQSVRDAIAGLFSRNGRDDTIETQLDGHAALVASAAQPDHTRQALHGHWAGELAGLLREDPTRYEALARFVRDYRHVLGAGGDRHPPTQVNVTHGSGPLFAVQGGDMTIRITP